MGSSDPDATRRRTLSNLEAEPARPAVSRAPLRLRPGQTVPRGVAYEIVEVLGEGGMGKVYKAYDAQLDRYVALKVLKPDVPEQERERFAREARLAANFSHPNLVRALDAGVLPDGKSHWMALEHLRGQDLAGMLEGQPRLAPAVLVDVFRQVLDALEYVHARGIVHCDVKPENIFLTRDPLDRRLPLVKVIDFGIHRDLRPPIELRRRLSGDPRYMAPEQAVLNGRLDGGADLYALGITLYEAATGAHPFADLLAGPVDALLAAHAQRPLPTVLGRLPGGVSRPFGQGLDALVRKACAKGREERFGSAGDMRRAVIRLGDLATLRTAA